MVCAESPVEQGFQAAYFYKGTSADQYRANGCFVNLQGIANGEPESLYPYWYFSRIRNIPLPDPPIPGLFIDTPALFRVSYDTHLNTGVGCSPMNVILISNTRCRHIGDIEYFRNDEITGQTGYIIAGFDNCSNDRAYIGFFREEDLDQPDENIYPHAYIDITDYQQNQALWVTSTEDGSIYCGSGKFDPKHIFYKYPASLWEDIINGGEVTLDSETEEVTSIELFETDGLTPFIADNWQGADFSDDGQVFYFLEGYFNKGHIISFKSRDGIAWSKEKSSNMYEYPFWYEVTGTWHEPEGISYFDMNDVDSYHPDMPRSELHAIVWDNFTGGSYIKHYSSIIDVHTSESVADVFYNKWNEGVWDGSILRIEGGSYDEQLVLEGRKVKIITEGTPAIIGNF